MRPLIILAVLTIAAGALGSPKDITSSGTYEAGEIVTIYGDSLGVKDPAPPKFWDTYENSALGAGTSLSSPDIGTHQRWDENGNDNVVDSHAYTGGQCLEVDRTVGSPEQQGPGANLASGSDHSHAYVNVKMILNVTGDFTAANVKLFRINPGQNGSLTTVPYVASGSDNFRGGPNLAIGKNYNYAYFDQPMVNLAYSAWGTPDDPENALNMGSFYWPGATDQWVPMEAYVKLGSAEAEPDGYAYFRFADVERAANWTTWNSYETCTPYADPGYYAVQLCEYGSGAVFYIDNFYADSTWMRVVLGNASSWSACTNFDPQPPLTWSNDHVTVTFNPGNASPNDTRWLYVVDSTGDHNWIGTPITIGGTVEEPAGPTGPPGTPVGLTATEN